MAGETCEAPGTRMYLAPEVVIKGFHCPLVVSSRNRSCSAAPQKPLAPRAKQPSEQPMHRKRSPIFVGLCLIPFLSACGGGEPAAPATTATQTVTVTPTETQTEPGLLPTTPVPDATTATGTSTAAGTTTATPATTDTGSATATATESPTGTETDAGTPTDSPAATEQTSGPKTIQINGKGYACSDLSENACDQGVTDAFNKWGDKLEGFANSDRLGTLGRGGSAKLPDDRI